MAALDKFLPTSSPASAQTYEDLAAVLVLAASSAAAELRILLASDDEEDEDGSDSGDSNDSESDGKPSGNDHSGHPTFKALKKKGMGDKMASAMCAKSDKQVKASALIESVTVALSGLAVAEGNWVELTAFDERHMVALAAGGAKDGAKSPYGDVQYADPGYQADGKKRYPVDTPEHARAAWSYVNQEKNASAYKPEQLAAIKGKIKLAAKKHGVQIGDDSEKVAATMVELAMRQAEDLQMMHHGPMTGKHSHGHAHTVISNEEHFHNNDSDHSRHTPGLDRDRW